MKPPIYFALCFILSVTFKRCDNQKAIRCGVKINQFKLKAEGNSNADTLKTNSPIILYTTLNNPDSVKYENLILKLYEQRSDSSGNFQITLFPTIANNDILTVEYKTTERDSFNLGLLTFVAELYNDTTLLDKQSQSIILVREDIIPNKQNTNDTSSSTNTIIATNPEYYSYKAKCADYNTPLFFEIRIQQKGKKIESNLTIQYSVSDTASIKLIGNNQHVIPIINPESPAHILNNCSFKIIKHCKHNAVGITVTLLKENTSQPIFSKTYWLRIGSVIEQRKYKNR